ncbi:MAG: glutathione S-transferase family protein [Myxococcota bacterium]
MELLIANKNYSSWSLRPWLLMKVLGLPFTERKVSFADPEWRAKLKQQSPAGRVPVLFDGPTMIWDSLAIIEYLADRFPAVGVWPKDQAARAYARSMCAEMHAGFSALRNNMPMNIEAKLPGKGWNCAVQTDVERIVTMWTDAREKFGAGGQMLFGDFCAVDAFYAPVVWRFTTYEVSVPQEAATYMQAIRGLPQMDEWVQEALSEQEYVAEDEPYRFRRN